MTFLFMSTWGIQYLFISCGMATAGCELRPAPFRPPPPPPPLPSPSPFLPSPAPFPNRSGASSRFDCLCELRLLAPFDGGGRAVEGVVRQRQSPAALRGSADSNSVLAARADRRLDILRSGLVFRNQHLSKPTSLDGPGTGCGQRAVISLPPPRSLEGPLQY